MFVAICPIVSHVAVPHQFYLDIMLNLHLFPLIFVIFIFYTILKYVKCISPHTLQNANSCYSCW